MGENYPGAREGFLDWFWDKWYQDEIQGWALSQARLITALKHGKIQKRDFMTLVNFLNRLNKTHRIEVMNVIRDKDDYLHDALRRAMATGDTAQCWSTFQHYLNEY